MTRAGVLGIVSTAGALAIAAAPFAADRPRQLAPTSPESRR
jgi:hypothetical protein